VAVGGYGRGMLAPGSDIDLLFLLPYKQTAWGESVAEAVLYALWDLGLKVGHSTRSVDECIRQARADMTIRTTLLETRLLAGDRSLFDYLRFCSSGRELSAIPKNARTNVRYRWHLFRDRWVPIDGNGLEVQGLSRKVRPRLEGDESNAG